MLLQQLFSYTVSSANGGFSVNTRWEARGSGLVFHFTRQAPAGLQLKLYFSMLGSSSSVK
jgi:hypothetical protein